MRIGDYVRTDDGLIAKYIGYNNEYKWHLFDGKIQWFYEYYRDTIDDDDWEEFQKEYVIKTSPNLIDLIEVGDYVNGGMVDLINDKYIGIENQEGYIIKKGFKIERIVTKELFESMELKVC